MKETHPSDRVGLLTVPEPAGVPSARVSVWLRAVLFSFAYLLCAELGRFISVPGTFYVSFWLPAGLYVAVLLLNETRSWPWFVLAGFPANLAFDLYHGTPFGMVVAFYLANTFEAVSGAWLLRRFVAEKPTLATQKEFFGLIGLSATLGSMLGAAVGATTLVATGLSHSFWESWRGWWGTNLASILIVTPFVLTWFSEPYEDYRRFFNRRQKKFEAALLVVVSITLTWHLLFVEKGVMSPNKGPLVLTVLWAALRFGSRGATAASLLVGLPLAFFTAQILKGLSPEQFSPVEYAYSLQLALAMMSITGLFPAIVLRERDQKAADLGASEHKYRKIFENVQDVFYQTDQGGQIIDISPSIERYAGYGREELIGQPVGKVFCSPDDWDSLVATLLQKGEVSDYEIRLKTKNGLLVYASANAHMLLDAVGKQAGIEGSMHDITGRKRAEQDLARQLAFDEIIQRQLARFASSTLTDLDDLIQESLQEIAQFIGVEIAFMTKVSPDNLTWSSTHEWCALGIQPRRERYQRMPLDRNDWSIRILDSGEVVRVEQIKDLPASAEGTRLLCEHEGFKSLLQVPLHARDGRVSGSVGLLMVTREIAWMDTDIKCLKMVSNAIANTLERHQSEQALRRSEARYRTLFEAAQDAIFINSGENFIDCNPHALEIFGCRREDLIGQSPARFSPPTQPDGRDSATAASDYIQAALSGIPQHFEWRHCRLDGTEFEAEVSLNRIDIEHQSLMIGLVRDITERKRAEAAVRESEAKFSTAFRASPDPMSIVDLADSCLLEVNEVFERVFGWPRDRVIGVSGEELGLWVLPGERNRFVQLVAQRGSVKDFAMVAKKRNGDRFNAVVSGELAEINGRKCMIIVAQDITERQRMEYALRLSEDRFRSAMQNSPIGMSIIAPDGKWLEANPALCDILGYTREELLAMDFQKITHPDDKEGDLLAVDQLLSLQIESHQSEKRYLHKDGTAIWIQLNISLAWIPGGTQRNFVCQIQDITKRKLAEQQLQKSRSQLKALSARLQSLREEERTHLAREIHDHLGQLLTALKLDLRSIERKLPPLGDAALIASLTTKLASARELTDETIKSIQQIASDLRPAILDGLGLEAAIDSETQSFQSRTGIKCEAHLPEKFTPTKPEQATAVFRIFQELLTNVARHAQATHVSVRLNREDGNLALEVSDDGVGMQESDLENPKSLGLLGIQERAEILGGRIVFGTGAGKGTKVTLHIPMNGKAGS